jgi:hypothetical protein
MSLETRSLNSIEVEMAKKSMDDPLFNEAFGCLYDGRPPNSDDDAFVNSIGFGSTFFVLWWDQSVNDIYQLTNWGSTPLVWQKLATNLNILAMIAAAGWQINTPRSYSDQSALGFNVSRRPSLTNDTAISLSVTLANTLLTTSSVAFIISPDDTTFTTISTLANLNEAVNSSTYSANPIVPAGYYYKMVTSGGGTITLVNLLELSL